MRLFWDRSKILKQLPSSLVYATDNPNYSDAYGSFFVSLSDYLTPLAVQQGKPLGIPQIWAGSEPANDREAVEGKLLNPQQLAIVAAIRSHGAVGNTSLLPAVVLHYTEGAVAFHDGRLPEARKDFNAAIASKAPAGLERYLLWSHYMLGRLATRSQDIHHDFNAVRTLLKAGVADDLGIAGTLDGEEAHIAWQTRADIPLAIHTYIALAIKGDESSWSSLYEVADGIVDAMQSTDAAERQQSIQWLSDRETREITMLYLYSTPYASGGVSPESSELVDTLDKVFSETGKDSDIGAARMAAIAWLHGRYDLAEKWAPRSDNALAWWIRGKLALRQGDGSGARSDYDTAIEKLKQASTTLLSQDMTCRVGGERAILAVQDKDYSKAATLMKAGGIDHTYYWWDVAYLAERILTVDELGHLVTASRPANYIPPQPPAAQDYAEAAPEANNSYGSLVLLYARRLMRSGRYDDALTVAHGSYLAQLIKQNVILRKTANNKSLSAQTRAKAWFSLANDTRQNGIELFGYTLDPDYEDLNGNFKAGDDANEQEPDEAARYKSTGPQHNVRFHYREIAADEAEHAASLLPHKSQAYAATLCWASYWVRYIDDDRHQAIYRQFAKHGARISWAQDFGTAQCPAPEF